MRKFSRWIILSFLGICLGPHGSAFAALADQVTIASVQYPMEGGKSQSAFFEKVTSYVAQASLRKAQIVLLPEWIVLDTLPKKSKLSEREAIIAISQNLSAPYWEHLKKVSKRHNIVIVGGTTAKQEGGKLYNSAVVIFPDGRTLEHRKVYLTKWERDNGVSPGKTATIFDTDWGRWAVLTCFDVEFPDLSVDLAKEEIDGIFVPSMTESPEGALRVRWTAQSRAIEQTSYVVVSPTVGKATENWAHFGQAVFLTPQLPGLKGLLSEGVKAKGGIWVETLDLKKLRELKKTSSWRPSKQIRIRN